MNSSKIFMVLTKNGYQRDRLSGCRKMDFQRVNDNPEGPLFVEQLRGQEKPVKLTSPASAGLFGLFNANVIWV